MKYSTYVNTIIQPIYIYIFGCGVLQESLEYFIAEEASYQAWNSNGEESDFHTNFL